MTDLEGVNSLAATAEYLKLTEQQVRNLVNSRQIGHIKNGRTLTFPDAAILAYKEAHVVAPVRANPHGLTPAAARRVQAS